jgi:Flp pilus assembly pilin Flp
MLKLFVSLQSRFMELRESEKGQAYVEYGILLAIVAVGLIAILGTFRNDIIAAFNELRSHVDGT